LPTNIHSNTIQSQVIKNSSYIKNFLILIYEEFKFTLLFLLFNSWHYPFADISKGIILALFCQHI
jgi:hypothetical protein